MTYDWCVVCMFNSCCLLQHFCASSLPQWLCGRHDQLMKWWRNWRRYVPLADDDVRWCYWVSLWHSRLGVWFVWWRGRGFDSWSVWCCVTTLGKLFTPLYLCHQPVCSVSPTSILVPVNWRWRSAAGKVTVGLASHRPCITEFSSER